MRSANCRSASGGIASSFAATTNHDGNDFHAGSPIVYSKVLIEMGCCTA